MSEKSEKKEQNQVIPTDPQQIADLLVGSIVGQRTSEIFSNGLTFSFGTFVNLLLLLVMGDIRDTVRLFLTNIVPIIKKTPIFTINLIKRMSDFRKIVHKFPERSFEIETLPSHNIELSVSKYFNIALYSYLRNNINCRYQKITTKATVGNLKEFHTTERWYGIQIGDIKILNEIEFEICVKTNEPIDAYAYNHDKNKTINEGELTSYLDIFDKYQADILKQAAAELEKIKGDRTVFLKNFENKKFKEYYTEWDLAEQIVANYPLFDKGEVCYYVGILLCLAIKCTGNYLDILKNIRDRSRSRQPLFIDRYNNYGLNFTKDKMAIVMLAYAPKSWPSIDSESILDEFAPLFNICGFNFNGYVSEPASKINTKTSIITFAIPPSIPEDEIDPLIKNLVQEICRAQKNISPGEPVEIYDLYFKNEVTKTEIPNPAYEQWLNKKKIIDSLDKINQNNNDKIEKSLLTQQITNFISQEVPPENIITESVSKVVGLKFLNETTKDLDTLYLRQKDMDKLSTSLHQFINKREILVKLGLPNKLNILLYGEPGTGKSSAIQAIATYLNRNIYYVDLNNVNTNRDLHKLFEYVNKNISEGGIIVIEDIDAMTDVVLKRETSITDRLNQIQNEESGLTLEYFLNILQGTLTIDGSVFIVTTNHIDHLDPAFHRDGRFDVKIELHKCDHYQIRKIYSKFLDREIPDDLLRRIPEDTYSPATIIFHIKDYLFSQASDEEILERFLIQS